ncbi:MAG: sulfotransferase family 2 domain-containing protein [Balneola sp.]
MVISNEHKYLFVEVPRTGSTAIRNELVENYSGEIILHKHATLSEFLRTASKDEKDYFILSGRRNPLDRTVSEFLKYRNNHNDVLNRFSTRVKEFNWFTLKYHRANYFLRRVKFAQKESTTFENYYNKFFNKPYCDFGYYDHPRSNFVLSFEQLNQDFETAIEMLGIDLVRKLPQKNKTKNKNKVFWDYYDTAGLRRKAMKNTSIYYSISGYQFPDSWGNYKPSILDWVKFYFSNFPKMFYWKYFRNK